MLARQTSSSANTFGFLEIFLGFIGQTLSALDKCFSFINDMRALNTDLSNRPQSFVQM